MAIREIPASTTVIDGAAIEDLVSDLANTLKLLHVPFDSQNLTAAVTPCSTEMTVTESSAPRISESRKSWVMNYTVVSFMMNGQVYGRLSNMLNLPPCSDTQ